MHSSIWLTEIAAFCPTIFYIKIAFIGFYVINPAGGINFIIQQTALVVSLALSAVCFPSASFFSIRSKDMACRPEKTVNHYLENSGK